MLRNQTSLIVPSVKTRPDFRININSPDLAKHITNVKMKHALRQRRCVLTWHLLPQGKVSLYDFGKAPEGEGMERDTLSVLSTCRLRIWQLLDAHFERIVCFVKVL